MPSAAAIAISRGLSLSHHGVSGLHCANGQGPRTHPRARSIIGMLAAHLFARCRTKFANRSSNIIHRSRVESVTPGNPQSNGYPAWKPLLAAVRNALRRCEVHIGMYDGSIVQPIVVVKNYTDLMNMLFGYAVEHPNPGSRKRRAR